MTPYVEKQIDLKKYFISLIRFLWLAVVLAVICAVALAMFMYNKDKKEYAKLQAELDTVTKAEDNSVDVEAVKASLDVVELQNVELAVEYYRTIKQYTKYKESSIYLSQNPYKVNKATLSYVVVLDETNGLSYEEQQAIMDNIVNGIINYINTGDFADALESDLGVAPQYINELVSASKNSSEYSLNTFDVVYIIDEDLGDIGTYVKECIAGYAAESNGNYANYTIELIEEYNAVVIDGSLDNAVQAVQTDIYNATSRINTLKKAFSKEQLICYNAAIGIVDVKVSEEEDAAIAETPVQNIKPAKISAKYVVVGIILGLVLYCGIVLMWLMFTSCVQAISGYESMFGIKLFGVLLPEKFYGTKNSLLSRMEYGNLKNMDYSTALGMVAIKVKIACKGVNKIAVISSNSEIFEQENYRVIKDKITSEGIEIVDIKNVLSEGKSLEQLIDIGGCILLEKTGVTKIKTLASIKELCAECDINLYGVIDVK